MLMTTSRPREAMMTTLPDSFELFWALWPDRVRVHVSCPLYGFFYQGDQKDTAVAQAYVRGEPGVAGNPVLARVFLSLCEEVGVPLEHRIELSREVFSDRHHFVNKLHTLYVQGEVEL